MSAKKRVYAFRVIIDSATGDPYNDSSNLKLSHMTNIDEGTVILGMMNTMHYDTADSLYYIHAIIHENKRVFYIRVAPDDNGQKVFAWQIGGNDAYAPSDAVWTGSASYMLGGSNSRAFLGF